MNRFFKLMSEEIQVFDSFVDDILSEDVDLLKGELDLLIMQHIFNSLELDKLDTYSEEDYLAA